MNLWRTLERAASLHPHVRALVEGDRSQSYLETRDRARQLASFLRASEVSAGDRVAVWAWNGIDFFEIYYAAAAIGAILVPLNVRLSAAEQAQVLRDCGARLLFADAEFADLVRAAAASGPRTDSEAPWPVEALVWMGRSPAPSSLEQYRSEFDYEGVIEERASGPAIEPIEVRSEDVAHLYYTSGTTGRSKGVMLTHGNVGLHALAAIGELSLGDRDVWAHIAPMFHLADAWATFAITWAGGKHVFLRHFAALDALDLVERERVTITNLVPTMLNLMVKHPRARAAIVGTGAATRPRDWSSLRLILSGGAPIAPDVVRVILATFGCEYVQTYGMTETSPYLTLSLLKERLKSLPFEEQLRYRCKTGRPFATIELRVVGENGVDVPGDDSAVGEIWVRGPTVTPGYWNRPEETRRAFDGDWLKTGDLARIDAEGYVSIVDRKKDMIITGGEKVFSIEVENVLYAHPAVLECAVFGVPDVVWGESVRAAVVLRPEARATESELSDACRALLAGYKVPRSITFLAHLPRTGSGKIYKHALRELFSSRAAE